MEDVYIAMTMGSKTANIYLISTSTGIIITTIEE
jgi:hypothetical protein